MFEDKLFLVAIFQQNRILIEGADLSRKLDSANQVNRDQRFVFADGIEKGVLNILCRL